MSSGVISQAACRVLIVALLASLMSPAFVYADEPPQQQAKKKQATTRPTDRPTTRPAKWRGDNTAGLPWREGRNPFQLWPRSDDGQPITSGQPVVLGAWSYRARRAVPAQDGVPWELICEPVGDHAARWQRSDVARTLPVRLIGAGRLAQGGEQVHLPVIELPEVVWRARMAADLQKVVGIHFHEYLSDDVARILFTLHQVPADPPEGATSVETHAGKRGTRIEATLLAPVVWHLDQSIVVRVDNQRTPEKDKRDRQTAFRVDHEKGHAEVSQRVLAEVPLGPQTWNLQECDGRRSRLGYFWKQELIGRTWDGYQGGREKIATLRTTIALVPPTRWSALLPIPPERVTQRHIDTLNDQIAMLGAMFVAEDKMAQEEFHSHRGAYDGSGTP